MPKPISKDFGKVYSVPNYKAVAKAIRPKIIPGKFANIIGKSRFGFLKKPYATHNKQLIAATKGCTGFPLCPAKLSPICGIYDTYIPIEAAIATQPKMLKNLLFSIYNYLFSFFMLINYPLL